MRRFDFLPSYHYEDNTDGIMNNPAELVLRDYTIEGNCGKNLIRYPYAQKTITTNGITFTDNGDGTITINGTATANAIFYINYVQYPLILEVGNQYTLSGGKSYSEGIILCLQDTSYKQSTWGGTITASYEKYYAFIRVNEGTVVDNFILKPQLELGETATEYEPYKTVGIKSPNLIPYPYAYTTRTINGITFTVNGDGSITVNGMSTDQAYFGLNYAIENIDTTKKYTLSGTTSNVRIYVAFYLKGVFKRSIISVDKPIVIEFPTDIEYDEIGVSIFVAKDKTVNNEKVYPQLELGETATEYIPYNKYYIPIKVSEKNIFDTERTTNIIIDSPLGPGESISKKADNLPEIMLNKSSNVITVDTEVKPKSTTYQYYTY